MADLKDLTKQQLKDILSLSQNIMHFNDYRELGQGALQWLIGHFGCVSGGFCLTNDRKLVDYRSGIYQGFSEETKNEYTDYYSDLDPVRYRRKPGPTVTITTDFISMDDLVSTEYYKDFMQRISILYELQIRLKVESQSLGLIFLLRSPKQKPFSLNEQVQAELMAPYFAHALQNVLLSQEMRLQEKLKHIFVSQMPCQALLILNHDLQPVYVSEGCYKVLSELRDIGPQEPHGDFELPSSLIERFRQSIDANEEIVNEGLQSIKISEAGGRDEISMNLLTLSQESEQPMYLVSFLPHETFLMHSEQLKQVGLSKRELEVISLLFLGLRNAEIADRLFISVLTVENHLRAIYEKLGVRNRTGVLQRALSLISPLHWPRR